MRYVKATEVRKLIEHEDVKVLDALAPESFNEKHLPGAINVPAEAPDFEDRVRRQLPDPNQIIIAYCSGLHCEASIKAARRLESMGYRNVLEFEGGLREWEEEGYHFERPGSVVQRPGEVEAAGEA